MHFIGRAEGIIVEMDVIQFMAAASSFALLTKGVNMLLFLGRAL